MSAHNVNDGAMPKNTSSKPRNIHVTMHMLLKIKTWPMPVSQCCGKMDFMLISLANVLHRGGEELSLQGKKSSPHTACRTRTLGSPI